MKMPCYEDEWIKRNLVRGTICIFHEKTPVLRKGGIHSDRDTHVLLKEGMIQDEEGSGGEDEVVSEAGGGVAVVGVFTSLYAAIAAFNLASASAFLLMASSFARFATVSASDLRFSASSLTFLTGSSELEDEPSGVGISVLGLSKETGCGTFGVSEEGAGPADGCKDDTSRARVLSTPKWGDGSSAVVKDSSTAKGVVGVRTPKGVVLLKERETGRAEEEDWDFGGAAVFVFIESTDNDILSSSSVGNLSGKRGEVGSTGGASAASSSGGGR
mmetsp:Transcript_19907/g.32653  ORF Transcript_19907/g.32653 Transcript_19907/m.32653 type:complete len:272 (-) Transcript_19907:1834-2649(-)